MRIQELQNHRVSYQVIVTFDLKSAASSDYAKIRNELSRGLKLEEFIHLSNEDGGNTRELPYNTLAALWQKDNNERDTRIHFEEEIQKIFQRLGLTGKYVVVVAQNWSVGAKSF